MELQISNIWKEKVENNLTLSQVLKVKCETELLVKVHSFAPLCVSDSFSR